MEGLERVHYNIDQTEVFNGRSRRRFVNRESSVPAPLCDHTRSGDDFECWMLEGDLDMTTNDLTMI